ncbi:MAG: hypothetical protein Q4E62_06955 [Sutterellaceae bacterium]|nr:hypothetical protein [Sutterellaceae bacterium]
MSDHRMLSKHFRQFAYRLTLWLTVVTLGLVPLMQPSAGMVDMPCAESSQAVVSATEAADCMQCPEHEQISQDTGVNNASGSFHFCCAPVLGVLTESVEIANDSVYFDFSEPDLPEIALRAQGIFRPPQA